MMVEISLMRDDSYVSSSPELNIINLSIQGSNFWGESNIVEREPISRRQYISDLVYMVTRALSWEALLRIIYLLEDWDTAYELDSMLNDDPELYYRFINSQTIICLVIRIPSM